MSGPQLVSLAGAREERDTERSAYIVETLERYLARAKAGQLRSIAVATSNADGTISTDFDITDDAFQLVGAVVFLDTRLRGALMELPSRDPPEDEDEDSTADPVTE